MKKLLAAMAVTFTAACGVQPSGVIRGAEAPTEKLDGPVLFFLNGKTLTRVTRPAEGVPGGDNLDLLGKGLTDLERFDGLKTQIPVAAAPITMKPKGDQAVVTISSPVADLSALAKDQITCTAVPPWQRRQFQVVITGTDRSVQTRPCPFPG